MKDINELLKGDNEKKRLEKEKHEKYWQDRKSSREQFENAFNAKLAEIAPIITQCIEQIKANGYTAQFAQRGSLSIKYPNNIYPKSVFNISDISSSKTVKLGIYGNYDHQKVVIAFNEDDKTADKYDLNDITPELVNDKIYEALQLLIK